MHSPDRLARRYAYQVTLVHELRRHNVEIAFLNYAIGLSPDEDPLLHLQRMFAENERAIILERSRCGTTCKSCCAVRICGRNTNDACKNLAKMHRVSGRFSSNNNPRSAPLVA